MVDFSIKNDYYDVYFDAKRKFFQRWWRLGKLVAIDIFWIRISWDD